jgi:hypothetical protein
LHRLANIASSSTFVLFRGRKKEFDEMTIQQSVKQPNLIMKRHRQALYDQIRRLGIKCLVPDRSDYKDDNGKATQEGHSPNHIYGLDQTLKIALQENKEIHYC